MTYKFRGKVIGSYQWVYGNLLNRVDSIGPLTLIEVQDKETFEIETFQVKPETVGVWTGLVDVNDKEIWEGDVYSPNYSKSTYKVMLVNGAFVGGKSEQSCLPLGWDIETGDDCKKPDMVEQNPIWLKVIGNIHDHPHLLNPAKGAVINTMNNFNSSDPGTQQAEEVKDQVAEQQVQATEQEAQEKALESEETEG